jgi:outer membrane lipoprotein-sorting protein
MEVVDTPQINSFAPIAAQTDFESPSEEAVFILNSGQLSALITNAIEKAIEPIQDRVKDLEKIVATQGKQIATLTSTQEQDVNRICLDIAFDRQRLAKLEMVEPQPMQRDRGEILRALLVANGGKMLAKDARQKMRLDKVLFSQLLAKTEDIEIRTYRLDKRQRLLVLK